MPSSCCERSYSCLSWKTQGYHGIQCFGRKPQNSFTPGGLLSFLGLMIGGELKEKKMLNTAEVDQADALEPAFIICTAFQGCINPDAMTFNS